MCLKFRPVLICLEVHRSEVEVQRSIICRRRSVSNWVPGCLSILVCKLILRAFGSLTFANVVGGWARDEEGGSMRK